MENKTLKELERAKEYFYQLKLIDAYNILRRFFDRLPFKPEREHGEFIGIFIRVLSELDKKNELNFYLLELEKLEPKLDCPFITYQLAMVYVNSEPSQLKRAIELLEQFLKKNPSGDFAAKAKMTLAYCYDSLSNDIAAARKLIFSIQKVEDKKLANLLETWKAKVFRDEGSFVEAENILNRFLVTVTPSQDWYSYFTAKIISIGLYREWNRTNVARQILVEVTQLSRDLPLRTVKRQLASLQESFSEQCPPPSLVLNVNAQNNTLTFCDSRLEFDESHPVDRLTKLLLLEKKLTKQAIIKILFDREYSPETDDGVIYYHIHRVKKILKKLGINNPKLSKKGLYYEYTGDVKLVEERV
jgi:tetratricopeptide (TPR) repeat protein